MARFRSSFGEGCWVSWWSASLGGAMLGNTALIARLRCINDRKPAYFVAVTKPPTSTTPFHTMKICVCGYFILASATKKDLNAQQRSQHKSVLTRCGAATFFLF